MSGIFGIIGNRAMDPGQLAGTFEQMQRSSLLHDWYTSLAHRDTNAYIGASGLPEQNLIQLAEDAEKHHVLVLYGEIFNIVELNGQYGQPAKTTVAQILLNGILAEGFAFLQRLEGRFQAVLWNRQKQTAVLFTDAFATRPLYWTVCNGKLIFASEIKTILCCPEVARTLNQTALVDFFTWGHYFHTHTSIESISLLPPAGLYSFEADSGTLTCETSGELAPTQFDPSQNNIDAVARAFHEAVYSQTRETANLGVSLSGGLDARSILGMVPKPMLPDVISVALGVPGSADHKLATQLAALAGTKHHNYELNTRFLDNYLANITEMVRLTDGQYLSSSIVIPTLPYYREQGIRTLLRGHAGELFHMSKAYAFSLAPGDLRTFSGPQSPKRRAKLTEWAFRHLQAYMLDGVTTDLFKQVSQAEAKDLARKSLEKALADAGLEKHDNVAQTLWFMYLKQRVFREIPLSMRKFDSQVNVRLPILDKRLMNALLPLPPQSKMAEAIQYRILSLYRPDFLRVKNVNTGTYIGSGILRQKIASLKHRILAKLQFPGYQPYEKMGLWLRRELAPVVEELLLKSDFLDRGIFNADTVRSVVATHNAGSNHTYLILALMISELQMRYLGL